MSGITVGEMREVSVLGQSTTRDYVRAENHPSLGYSAQVI